MKETRKEKSRLSQGRWVCCRIFILCLFALLYVSSVSATVYYVANDGDDDAAGTSPSAAWATLSKVTATDLNPGDGVFLKTGDEWEETLTIDDSGTSGSPIVIGAYGNGDDPVISLSTTVTSSDWSLVYDVGGVKVWRSAIENVKWAMGVVKGGTRVTVTQVDEDDYASCTVDENAYVPYNVWEQYYRSDDGNPGTMDIGSRRYGIYVDNADYVTIQDIDFYGPSGNWEGIGVTGVNSPSGIKIVGADHVTVQRCSFNHGGEGNVTIDTGSTNCTATYIDGDDNMSALVFVTSGNVSAGHEVSYCTCTDVKTLSTDTGDGSCYGVYDTDGVTVKFNKGYRNGYDGITALDGMYSNVSSNGNTWLGNYAEDCGAACYYVAANSDNNLMACNVANGWGQHGGSLVSGPREHGMRVGDGTSGNTHTGNKIYNNLFYGDGGESGEFAALYFAWSLNADSEIVNNVFDDNNNLEAYFSSRSSFSGWSIETNLFYCESGNGVKWDNTTYDCDHVVGTEAGYFSYDISEESGTLTTDPRLWDFGDYKYGMKSGSPLLQAGTTVSGVDYDYFGNTRVVGSAIDIGPCEGTFHPYTTDSATFGWYGF